MGFKILIGIALLASLLLSGCASVPYSGSVGDGKCHEPDYNAPGCIYLF